MKHLLRFGILAAGVILCFGCGGEGKPTGVGDETEQLYESEEYQEQMMDESPGEP